MIAPRTLFLVLLLGLFGPLMGQEDGQEDEEFDPGAKARLQLKDRAFDCLAYRETRDGLEYKVSRLQPRTQQKRWGEIVSLTYAGMASGYYKAGADAKQAGDYAQAATHFRTLVDNAKREWEGAYGLFEEGGAWELAGAAERAMAAFAQFCETYPEHRFWLDAKYRQGIAAARAGDDGAAEQVIADLDAFAQANDRLRNAAGARANAIRAALLAGKGDFNEARSFATKASFRPGDGPTWFHWGNFWASFLTEKGNHRDAVAQYERMLRQLGRDQPALRVKLSLGLGIALARDDRKEEALPYLVAIDALPFGSRRERAEAQYWGGRLLWETAKATLDASSDTKEREFAAAKQDQARVLLRAAANTTADTPARENARDFLQTLPTPPEGEGDEATAAAAAVPLG